MTTVHYRGGSRWYCGSIGDFRTAAIVTPTDFTIYPGTPSRERNVTLVSKYVPKRGVLHDPVHVAGHIVCDPPG